MTPLPVPVREALRPSSLEGLTYEEGELLTGERSRLGGRTAGDSTLACIPSPPADRLTLGMLDRPAAVISGVGERQAQRHKSRVTDRIDVPVIGDVGANEDGSSIGHEILRPDAARLELVAYLGACDV